MVQTPHRASDARQPDAHYARARGSPSLRIDVCSMLLFSRRCEALCSVHVSKDLSKASKAKANTRIEEDSSEASLPNESPVKIV